MKKKLGAFCFLSLILLLSSCGEKKAQTAPVKPEPPKIKVYHLDPVELPEWYYDEDAVVKKEPGDVNYYLYLKISREGPTPQKANYTASANISGMLAEIIGSIASVEMDKATETMLKEAGISEEYYRQTVATIAHNVDISGAMPAGKVIEHLAREIPDSPKEEFYRATVRIKMNYETFLSRLKGETDKTAPRISEHLKEQARQLLESSKIEKK